jgi:hypothetical protein
MIGWEGFRLIQHSTLRYSHNPLITLTNDIALKRTLKDLTIATLTPYFRHNHPSCWSGSRALRPLWETDMLTLRHLFPKPGTWDRTQLVSAIRYCRMEAKAMGCGLFSPITTLENAAEFLCFRAQDLRLIKCGPRNQERNRSDARDLVILAETLYSACKQWKEDDRS